MKSAPYDKNQGHVEVNSVVRSLDLAVGGI